MLSSKQAFRYAWRQAGPNWHTAWVAIIGGAVGGLGFWTLGLKMPHALQEILDNPLWNPVFGVVACAVTGVVIVFVARLLWWPFHKRLEVHGGLRAYLGERLGAQMWPIIFMVSGVASFVVLFGGGAIGFLLVLKDLPHGQTVISTTATTPPITKPLPAGAKFAIGDRVFWYLTRPYGKDEADGLLKLLPRAYDFVIAKGGPVYMGIFELLNNWPGCIAQDGPMVHAEKLGKFQDLIRDNIQQLSEIENERPYYREDISGFFGDGGLSGALLHALQNYIMAVQIIPKNADLTLIKNSTAQQYDALQKARGDYSGWVSRVSTIRPGLRDELTYFAHQ